MGREFGKAKTNPSSLRDSLRSQRNDLAQLKRGHDGADTSTKALSIRNKALTQAIENNRLTQSRTVEQVNPY